MRVRKKGQFDDEDRKKGRLLKYVVDANRFLITFEKNTTTKYCTDGGKKREVSCHCGKVPIFITFYYGYH